MSFDGRLPGIVERIAWPRHCEQVGKSAILSDCRTYRYGLFRIWDPDRPLAMFIGLNPSTADEFEDDPTIRRCVRFARDWGKGGLIMANLYAYRATKPDDLPAGVEAIGPQNDEWLQRLRGRAGVVVAAWGAHRRTIGRAAHVMDMIPRLHILDLTATGHPRHPLYVRASTLPIPWTVL